MTTRSALPRRFFTKAEQEQIVAAIAAAEKHTTGEIRVYIERSVKQVGHEQDATYVRAREVFARLGMQRTEARNGVLVYLAVRSRRFAIVGDEELHRRVGDDYWLEIRDSLAADFATERFAEGLVAAITAIGDRLGDHFPPRSDDRNELTDDIAY